MTADAAPEKIPLSEAPARRPIGPILRAARLKRGQSIESIAALTRIPKRYLVALEEDRLEDFPAAVYLRGFLNGYCEHLDLPFEPLWASLSAAETAPAAPVSADTAAGAPAASIAARPKPPAAPAATIPASFAPLPSNTPAGSSAIGAIAFSLALAVAGAAWILHDRGAAPPPKPAQTMPRALLPVSKPVSSRVVLHALDDCWARVSVDGDVVFEGRIPRGAMMDWTPVKSMSLRAASVAALEVTKDGAPFELSAPSPDGDYRIELP